MSIVFRCPKCDHKVRAGGEVAGKQCRCKCGAAIDVPAVADVVDPSASVWALKPASPGEALEPISTWSPLYPQTKDRPYTDDFPLEPAARWRAILIGIAGVLGLILVIGLGTFVFRKLSSANPGPADLQTAEGGLTPNAVTEPEVKPPINTTGPPPDASEPTRIIKPPTVPPKVKEKDRPVKDAPVLRGLALANPPGFSADGFDVKRPPQDGILSLKDGAEKTEIRTWFSAPGFSVEENDGKINQLSLNKEAMKLGVVLVAVKVRLPAESLIGREFVVLNPDARLIAPDSKVYHAIGISVGDGEKLWFAPPEGQRSYSFDKSFPAAGPVTQSWLFIAPIADLESGRILFQFKEQSPVVLRTGLRRK